MFLPWKIALSCYSSLLECSKILSLAYLPFGEDSLVTAKMDLKTGDYFFSLGLVKYSFPKPSKRSGNKAFFLMSIMIYTSFSMVKCQKIIIFFPCSREKYKFIPDSLPVPFYSLFFNCMWLPEKYCSRHWKSSKGKGNTVRTFKVLLMSLVGRISKVEKPKVNPHIILLSLS